MAGHTLLLVLHMAGNLLWIGSIVALAVTLSTSGQGEARRGVALAIYRRISVPAFLASLVGGAVMLSLDTTKYLVDSRWMHPKLTLVLVVIALHHVLGARAKRLAGDAPVKGASVMGIALVICAVSAAFLALAKPF
jgi:protoporphyrinogen IX oxidase